MQPVLAMLPPRDRPAVRAGAGRLAVDLIGWAGPALAARLDAVLVNRVATVVAAIGTELAWARRVVLARYSLWSVLLDDRLDAPDAEPAVLRAFAERVCRIARGDRPAPRLGFLGDALVELLVRLRAYDPGGALYERLTAALCDAVRAGVEQARLGADVRTADAAAPSVGRYLAVASRDVNYRGFAYALVLLTGRPNTFGALDRLDAALVPACRAVRIANDVRSVDRDRAAGRLNVLSLRREDGAPMTTADAWREVDAQVRRHYELLAALATEAPAPAVTALYHSLRVAVGLYRVTDLRAPQPGEEPLPWRPPKPRTSPTTR